MHTYDIGQTTEETKTAGGRALMPSPQFRGLSVTISYQQQYAAAAARRYNSSSTPEYYYV